MELRKPEETVRLLRELAVQKGDDFRVRVTRKRSPSSMPESVATFDGATVEQITQPETWLPQLAGGGPEYILQIYHANDKTELLGTLINPIQGEVRPADTRIVGQSGWAGPRIVVFPRPPAPSDEGTPTYSVPIVSPGTGGAVPRTEPGGGAGGHVGGLAIAATVQAQYEDIDRRKKRLGDEEKALAERQKNMEVAAATAAGKAVADRLERDLADARAQAMRVASTPPAVPPPPGESLGSVLKEVVPVLVKVFVDFQAQASSQRLELAKMQMDVQRDLAKIQQAAQDKLTELMIQNANRPIIPSELKDILFKDKDEAASKAMAHVMDAMGTMTNMTMNVLGQVSEMQLGGRGEEDGGGALKLVREGLRTVMAFTQAAATRKAAQVPPGVQQRQLPEADRRHREEELRRRKVQLEARRGEAQRKPTPTPAKPPTPVPPPPPVQAQAQPSPVPTPPQAAPAPAPAFAGIPEPPESAATSPSVLDDVIALIRDRTLAPDDVAAQILQKSTQDDGSLQKAVAEEYDGSFGALFADRLGDEWLDGGGNLEYLDGVIRAVATKGVEAGVFDPELMEHLDELTAPLYDEEEDEGEGGGEEEKGATP